MTRWMRLALPGLVLVALAAGCGDDDAPSLPPGPDPGAFWEPLRFCVTGTAAGDTLIVYNVGEGPLEWKPTRVPARSTGLGATITVAPGRGVAIPWQWNPQGPYPALDTLLAATGDPARPQAMVLFRRADPADPDPRTEVPLTPLLGFPLDGAVFAATVDTILAGWSREDACRGAVRYYFQLDDEPGFLPPRLIDDNALTLAEAVLIVEPGDRGKTVYWRVAAEADLGGLSPWSEVRSWSLE